MATKLLQADGTKTPGQLYLQHIITISIQRINKLHFIKTVNYNYNKEKNEPKELKLLYINV